MLHTLTHSFAILMLNHMSGLIRYSCSDKHTFLICIMQNLACFLVFSFISFVVFKAGHDSFERRKRKMFIKEACASRKNANCGPRKTGSHPRAQDLYTFCEGLVKNVMEVH